MDIFATSIKEKYQERLVNREKQWPLCHSDKLVRLELVERQKGVDYFALGKDRNREEVKHTPLAYDDLFKVKDGRRPVRKVLVEGDAGIGKTTLSVSVSEDWANGMLFQQFELVLLVPLRHKKVAAVSSLPELLMLLHSDKKLCGTIADLLEQTEGKKVLIIADGWDELPESGRLEGSFLYELVFGELLSFVSVLLTSRPSASAPLHQLPCIDRFAKVRGFNKEHIVEYIQSEFASNQEKAGRLLEQLEYNPLVESVCSIPLNCAIICHLWRTLEEALPTTMTELYKKIILSVVCRNIQKKPDAFKLASLPNFNAFPTQLQQSWALLCKFAFETIVRDQIVFSEEDLANIFPFGLDSILCFGLLQTANTILETGYGLSFHFLHLTFQEYLAALYLVKQIISDQESDLPTEQLKLHLSNSQSGCDAVIREFIFGIYSNEIEQKNFTALQPFIPTISRTLLNCRCAFEAKSIHFCSNLFNGSIFDESFDAYSAYDCAAVLYVIANITTQKANNVHIKFGSSGVRENQIRELADVLAEKNGILQVKTLDLSGNKLSDESVNDLFHRALVSFQSLSNLNLEGSGICTDSITVLVSPTFNRLSCLVLSDCPLGVPGMQALENAVRTGSLHGLEELNLAGSLTGDADINGALLATSLGAIMSHNFFLESLNLSRNNLGVPGASALAGILHQHKQSFTPQGLDSEAVCTNLQKLIEIYLDETNLGDEGIHAFVKLSQISEFYWTLKDVEAIEVSVVTVGRRNQLSIHRSLSNTDDLNWSLKNNNIHGTGMSYLADGVITRKVGLQALSLDDNPLGLEGATEIGRIISSRHCRLRKLSLCRCQLTTPDSQLASTKLDSSTECIIGKQFYHAYQNHTLFALELDGNNFT